MAHSYNVRYIVTMEYTAERQESDRSFLVGVNYGRESERARIKQVIEELHIEVRFLDFDIARLREALS